jgi:drug/metabolite transporter (DMT)-like permease
LAKLYGALGLLSLIWGMSFYFIKMLLEDLGPFAIVFGRCFFGAVTLALIAFASRKNVLKGLPWTKLLLVGILNNALPWLFISASETKITSSLASIVNATTPLWTLIIGFLFFSSSLRKNQWVGIIIGFVGIFILSDISSSHVFAGDTVGVLYMIGAAACYGIGTQLSRKYFADLTVLQISLTTLSFASIVSFVLLMLKSPHTVLDIFQLDTLLLFIGLGSFGSGVAYLLFYYLVQKGSAEFASLVTYLVPVTAILWGAILLNEQVKMSMILGLMIIFSGVYISSLKLKKKEKNKQAA